MSTGRNGRPVHAYVWVAGELPCAASAGMQGRNEACRRELDEYWTVYTGSIIHVDSLNLILLFPLLDGGNVEERDPKPMLLADVVEDGELPVEGHPGAATGAATRFHGLCVLGNERIGFSEQNRHSFDFGVQK